MFCDLLIGIVLPTAQLYLEDFDLTASRMQMLCILPILILLKGVNLDSEWHTLFSTMLPHSELCADAVNLEKETIKEMFHKSAVMLLQ